MKKLLSAFCFGGLAMVLTAADVPLKVLNKKDGKITNFQVSKWGASCNFKATLKKDAVYLFSFDLKKTVEKDVTVTAILQTANQYHTFSAMPGFQHVSLLFRPVRDGEHQFVLNDGNGKSAGFEVEKPVLTELSGEDLQKGISLLHGENSAPAAGWKCSGKPESAASDLPGGVNALVLNPKSSCKRNVFFRPGHRYQLEFWTKSDAPGQLAVQLNRWSKPSFLKTGKFAANTQWKKYSVECDFTEKAIEKCPCLKDGTIELTFSAANQSRILLDNVRWIEVK